jgi:hypothetical protein
MDSDGSNVTQLTTDPGYEDGAAWSPDGSRIAFHGARGDDLQQDIYVIDVDGTDETNLTNDEAVDFEPEFSPDGSRILFTSRRTGDSEIFVMGADGSSPTNLSQHGAQDEDAAWSPDGTRIAFVSNRSPFTENIWVMGADGTSPVVVTPDSSWVDINPDWSPDGNRIVFSSLRDGNYELYAVNVDGTAATNLTNNPGDDRMPSWDSPPAPPPSTTTTTGTTTTTTATTTTTTTTPTPPPPPPPPLEPGEGALEFDAAAFRVTENESTAQIRVRRTGSTTGTITVDFATSDGSAVSRGVRVNAPVSRVPENDYVRASGTLVFGDGESEHTLTVPIVDDTAIEGDETVNLTLLDPGNGGTLGPQSTAELTIGDNDPSVSFARATSTTTEDAGVARIDVELSVTTTADVSVGYAVTGGNATFGTDHLLSTGLLRFRGRQNAVTLVADRIRVPLVDDDRRELPETLRIELSSPNNAFLGSIRAHTVTIDDDDPSGDLAGHTVSTAFVVDVGTQPRQVLDEHLPRFTDPADMYRVHLDAGDRLALDVDPRGPGDVDRLDSSTLIVLASDGTTELARVGRSREPDTGAFSDNPAHLFIALATSDYFVRLETRDPGRWNGYTIEFHRLALSDGGISPHALDAAGSMYAWLDGDILYLTGPTGYGFALEGAWTREATFERRSGRTTTTYRLAAEESLVLHTALGELSVPVFEDITVPTAPSTWGASFGRVTSSRIRLRVGLPLSSFEGELFAIFNAVFQYQGGTDIDTWYVELGDRILRQTTVDEVLRGVPYLRSSDHTLLPIRVEFGTIEFEHAGPLTNPATIIADLADPYLYIEHVAEDRTIIVGLSRHGYVPYRPLLPPTDPEAVGLDAIYGHAHVLGGGIVGTDLAPIEVFGAAVEDFDANDDGTWLAGLGNADEFAHGDLSAIEDVFQDVNRGLDVELNVHYQKKAFDLRLPLGRASAIYNGAEGALWFRAVADDPFAGTPLAFVQPTVGAEAEGVIRTDGSLSFTVQGEMSLGGAGDLGLLVHLDDDGIEAVVDGEIEFSASGSVDGVGATCTVRAGAEGTVRFSYANGLRTAGSLRLDGRVRCRAGGIVVAQASFDVGAGFDNDSITVDLPYIGEQTLRF